MFVCHYVSGIVTLSQQDISPYAREVDMDNIKLKRGSKFLSYVLRHDPGSISLSLDPQGWALVDDLINLTQDGNPCLTRALILDIVANCEKQRFTLDDSGLKIRANQGHSIEIDLGLESIVPPDQLYHGTASRYLEQIMAGGLQKRNRHHVHLTESKETAKAVGQRHGKVVVLVIDARSMHNQGHIFHLSKNCVWLVDSVPVDFIRVFEP